MSGESGPVSIALRCGGVEMRLVCPVAGKLALAMRDVETGDAHLLPVDPGQWVWFSKSAEVVARTALGGRDGGNDDSDGSGERATSGMGLGGRCCVLHGDGRGDAGVSANAAASAGLGASQRGCADLPAESRRAVGQGEGQ